eukprot:CAMPEP_0167794972 /NCGR_PEP_ID=MMETSP0111_2-20121227/14158_1 /TAXON_ID=91324 /ORGANISM="Lotharella globosa, Strain CCCM811" /LENGTH=174 /DNA_ID=CAMNT_0007688551 /DNA_START=10 /DNA_END=534 /DNA_ORIENTATION=-
MAAIARLVVVLCLATMAALLLAASEWRGSQNLQASTIAARSYACQGCTPTLSLRRSRALSRMGISRGRVFPCRAEVPSEDQSAATSSQMPGEAKASSSQSPAPAQPPIDMFSTETSTVLGDPRDDKGPTKFTRKQSVAVATGAISIILGLGYMIGAEVLGGRELKDAPAEAMGK